MTYVADDMTLKGTGSKVTLGKNNKNNNAKYVALATEAMIRKILSQAIVLLLS